jgi:4-amino-4-deoxy-L-arabinose transferase-like glycosyltransferase
MKHFMHRIASSVRACFAEPTFRRWILSISYICTLYLVGLGSHGLLEPDEGRYANMAMEFLEPEHSWLEPSLSDINHYDKPPLIYWVTAGAFSWFGLNEFAARLPSFLGSMLALAGVFLISFRLYGERGAWWATLACAATLQFWLLGRLLSPDMLMCGLSTLGAGLLFWGGEGRRRWLWWGLGAAVWSLAWWTKATACLVPLAALALSLLLTGKRDLLGQLRPLRLFAVILIFGAPWYLLMISRHGELEKFFLHRELVGRVMGHEDGRTGFPGYHFVAALALWLPWWPWAVRQVWTALRTEAPWKERLRAIPFEFVTAALVLVIFSFISSRLITYTLTGVPWLAIGIGGTFRARHFSLRSAEGRWLIAGLGFVITVLWIIPRMESSLGVNSTTREVVEVSRSLGAEAWVCDRFLPGLEFYGGEFVWYVNTKSLVQVETALGQFPKHHFLSTEEARRFVLARSEAIWLVQTREEQPNWMKNLLLTRSDPTAAPVKVGSFRLWKLRE